MLRRQVALRAVLGDDIEKAGDHGDAGYGCARGPVYVDAVGGVEIGAVVVCNLSAISKDAGGFWDDWRERGGGAFYV